LPWIRVSRPEPEHLNSTTISTGIDDAEVNEYQAIGNIGWTRCVQPEGYQHVDGFNNMWENLVRIRTSQPLHCYAEGVLLLPGYVGSTLRIDAWEVG